jgi:hypothetical protein
MNEKIILKMIRQWHEQDRRSTILRTFKLGDLILKAVIHTGLTENDVIHRIMDDLGEIAMGQTSYNRAARMARVFTKNQRGVLIERAVSLERAEILAGAKYEGRKRINVIHAIKTGKIKAPWSEIRGMRDANGRGSGQVRSPTGGHFPRPGYSGAASADCILSLRDEQEVIANKLRAFLIKRSDALEIITDVMSGIKPADQVQHPESWRRKAI